MIRLLTPVLLFASFHAVAEVTLTPLNNNTPADADDVMGNFNALKSEIESLPLPPSDCTTNQIIKWDSSEDAWICSNRAPGTITMVDMWYANKTDGDSGNVEFTRYAFSGFGGQGNHMAFTAGADLPNGFSFPETGFYEIHANFRTYAPARTSVQTVTAERDSGNGFGYSPAFSVRPAGIPGGSSEAVYVESSMNFVLDISNVETQRLRFNFRTVLASLSDDQSSLGSVGSPRHSIIIFRRIEP